MIRIRTKSAGPPAELEESRQNFPQGANNFMRFRFFFCFTFSSKCGLIYK